MVLNFFLVTWRNIARNRTYFLVSVSSLSVGIAAALVIFIYVRHEMSYDKFHSKSERIVRINSRFAENDMARTSSRTPFPLKAVLLQNFPEIESVARFAAIAQSRALLSYNETVSYEDMSYADPDFLLAFDFHLLKGDRRHALDNPNSIILTEETAGKYFGDDDPMGKTIRYQSRVDLTVTGIMATLPDNSHIRFDVLLPIEFQRMDWKVAQNNFYDFESDWMWNGAWTYVVLRDGAEKGLFEAKIEDLPKTHYPEDTRNKYRYELQNLTDIHFAAGVTATPTASTSRWQIVFMSIIGALILIVAAINITNLTTAQAPLRSKEVGLRKTLGAFRWQVIIQFLSETLIIVVAASLGAIAFLEFGMSVFTKALGRAIIFSMDGEIVLYLCLGVLFVTLFAGLYPAILLSRPTPNHALKGILSKESSTSLSLRSGLVIFQLTVSIILISGILIIQDQMAFLKSKDLGFDKSKIITIKNGTSFRPFTAFKEQLKQVVGITDVYRGYFPGELGWNVTWAIEGKQDPITMPVQMIDENFVSMFGLTVIAGRDFIPGSKSDTLSALINEKMARDMGWTNEDALGRKLSYIGGNDNKTQIELRVIGILQNANLESLYKPVQAMIFQPSAWGGMAVKIHGKTAEMLKAIERTYKQVAPDWPFEYTFLDADIQSLYQKEEKLAEAVQGFATLAVVISCCGLLALCSFVTRQRIKEVAIRKVHGASTVKIAILLGRYFFGLAVISLVIASPVIYYFSDQWLSTFAFAIKPGLSLAIEITVVLLALILAGVSYHISKVSQANPASILKSE